MTQVITETPADYEQMRIIERPDGFYWQAKSGDKEYGPFATLREAMQDMQTGDSGVEPGESIEEAEAELGIAGWLDPDTGELAEESIPRLEEH